MFVDKGDEDGLTVTVVFVKPSSCWRSYMVDIEGAVSPGGSPRKLEALRRDIGLSFFDGSLRVAAWLDKPAGCSSADVDLDMAVSVGKGIQLWIWMYRIYSQRRVSSFQIAGTVR